MKLFIVVAAFACYLCAACNSSTLGSGGASLAVQSKTPQDTYKLSTDSKKDKAKSLPVSFSHVNHSTKNYSGDGTKPIGCVECHHTDQPAAEAAKRPPLKTAHPADRTTTLTAEPLKDAAAPGVNTCRSCHAQEGSTPKLGGAIPEVTYEGESDPVVLTNEEAFHRNCAGCHDAAADARKTVKAPTSTDCKGCHTGP
jgi:nitrate reductase cytochrome c-type subunit